MTINTGLGNGYSTSHSKHSYESLGDASKVSFEPKVNVSGVSKVEAWVTNEWAERTLKNPNDDNPSSTQYTFTTPTDKHIIVKYGTAPAAPIKDVKTITFQANDKFKKGDHLIINNKKPSVAQVDSILFPTKANMVADQYFTFYDTAQNKYAVAFSLTGSSVPSSPVWQAIADANKIVVDLSSGSITTGAHIVTATVTAINAKAAMGAVITASASTATLVITHDVLKYADVPQQFLASGAVSTNLTIAQTAQGYLAGSGEMTKYGVYFNTTDDVAQVDTIEFPAKNILDNGEYFVLTAQDGATIGCQLDVSGDAPAPTASTWTSTNVKVIVDLSSGEVTTNAHVGQAVKTALLLEDELAATSGTGVLITVTGDAQTLTFTQETEGLTEVPKTYGFTGKAQIDTIEYVAKDDHDAGEYIVISAKDGTKYAVLLDVAGDITASTSTAWVAIPASNRKIADLSLVDSATHVADKVNEAFESIVGFSTKIELEQEGAVLTFTQKVKGTCVNPVSYDHVGDGVAQIDTIEFPAQASLDDDEFFVICAEDGTSYAVMLDTDGALGDPTSETEWDEADHWLKVDLSGQSSATNVAQAVKSALEVLDDFKEGGKIAITGDAAVLTFTQAVKGACTNPISYDYTEPVNITIAQATAGVAKTLNVTIVQTTAGSATANNTIAQTTIGVDGDPIPSAISTLGSNYFKKLNVHATENANTIATNFVTVLESIVLYSTTVMTNSRTDAVVTITQTVTGDAHDYTDGLVARAVGETKAYAIATTTIGKTNCSRITYNQGSNTMHNNLNNGLGKNALT